MIFRRAKSAPRGGERGKFAQEGGAEILPFPAPPQIAALPPKTTVDAGEFEHALGEYSLYLNDPGIKSRHDCIDYTPGGLRFQYATFTFPVSLASRRVEFALIFFTCTFPHPFKACLARIDSLSLEGSTLNERLLAASLTVRGGLNLRGVKSHAQIDLSTARIRGDLDLFDARLSYRAPQSGPADAPLADRAALLGGGLRVHSILMEKLVCNGRIFLDASRLTGVLKAGNAVLRALPMRDEKQRSGWDHVALNLVDANIEGAVILGEESRVELDTPATFEACGQVNLSNSRIGGDLICTNGRFYSHFYLPRRGGQHDEAEEQRRSELEKFGSKSNEGGTYDPVVLATLNVSRTQIEGGVRLDRGFRSYGEVRFNSVNIRGVFKATNDSEINAALPHCEPVFDGSRDSDSNRCARYPYGSALSMDRAQIGNTLLLKDGFRAFGRVSLRNATISSDVDCTGGWFHGSWPVRPDPSDQQPQAFVLSGASISGSVFLVGARTYADEAKEAKSPANFTQDDLDRRQRESKERTNNIFRANGQVRLRGTRIERNLHLGGGQFSLMPSCGDGTADRANDEELPLIGWFHSAHVAGTTFLSEEDRNPVQFHGSVSFRDMHTDGWEDSMPSWPQCREPTTGGHATLELNGLTYKNLRGPTKGEERLLWLLHQPKDDLSRTPASPENPQSGATEKSIGFKTQPWEQCATALYDMGYRTDARFLYRMEQRFIRYKSPFSLEGVMNFLLGTFVGHGYRVLYALFWAAWLIGLGTLVAKEGYHDGYIVPAPAEIIHAETGSTYDLKPGYPTFHPFLFSLDMALPAGNVRQVSYWIAVDRPLSQRSTMSGPPKFNISYRTNTWARRAVSAVVPDGPWAFLRSGILVLIAVLLGYGLYLFLKWLLNFRRETIPDFSPAPNFTVEDAGKIYHRELNRERNGRYRKVPRRIVSFMAYMFFALAMLYFIERSAIFSAIRAVNYYVLLPLFRTSFAHMWFVMETFAGWLLVTAVAVALGSTVFHYRRDRL